MKLADFGLARPFDADQQRPYTNRVITLWYRPPELLLGATMYGPAIDMWSAGCIFAELLLRKPILPGKNEFEQIDLIFKLLGTPDEASWPACKTLQYYDMILSQNPRKYQSRFEDKFGGLDPSAKDLLRKLLVMDPDKRISADDALDHEWFWSDPVPATPDQLPKYPPSHEFTAKKRRQASQQQQQQQNQHQNHQQQHNLAPQGSSHPHAPPGQHHTGHNSGPGHGAHNPYGAAHSGLPNVAYPQQQHPTQTHNPYYANRGQHGGGAYGGGAYAPQGGLPSAKRFRDGPPPAGGGFFDAASQNGAGPPRPGHAPPPHPYGGHSKPHGSSNGNGGGYPGGGWPRG